MVYRIYVEKKKEFANEAAALLSDIRSFLGISGLSGIRLFNRYDVENIDEAIFERAKTALFSEPQLDNILYSLPDDASYRFAAEYLPGQFDQRADSAAQCVQIMSCGERPSVRTARVYLLYGEVSAGDIEAIKKYVINPVESREASFDEFETLDIPCEIPTSVPVLEGFTGFDEAELEHTIDEYALAMDLGDITMCRDYFLSEKRDPTLTEIRMLDTYWSDHCRHTTFLTTIDGAEISDPAVKAAYERYLGIRKTLNRTKPVNLMDIATIGAKYLKHTGQLKNLDESEEINACTVKIKVSVDGVDEDWLLLFKNETHNHPTEIEPFGGAATCIGGAIRDPLSGRGYVYQAMRVTGASNPLRPVEETIKGKLPQRKIVTTAASGYSSYGNQIGLATGQVDEIYHDGYVAKHLEIGAVVGAAPAKNVRREVPQPGDIIVLLGGRTGRDGCGGATGSSKSHNLSSLEKCGAEVQKGNAPEERKLQRLFRNAEATALIKRCNDFGAGGVSVAIGELADGLKINLDAVPKKYEGLDGTELAISESQERMAVVLAPEDVEKFISLANGENLEATVVAVVTAEPRLIMTWNGAEIVNISRDFLNSNGAEKHIIVKVANGERYSPELSGTLEEKFRKLVSDINICSKRGLSERFDSTIGAGSVLMPFGGKYQLTPAQAMAAKIPLLSGETDTCSVMAYGFNPFISEKSPYIGAYLAVTESVSKLVASGADTDNAYLTFQEYFERVNLEPERWGKPLSALLGALDAQTQLGIGAIGGKDSMSGSFEKIDVPPTLVSFAVSVTDAGNVISPEFKVPFSKVVLVSPEYDENGIPVTDSLKKVYAQVTDLIRRKKALAVYTPTLGGIAEGVVKMCLGNRIGFTLAKDFDTSRLFKDLYGSFIIELLDENEDIGEILGETSGEYFITAPDGTKISLDELQQLYESKLESVYACNIPGSDEEITAYKYKCEQHASPVIKTARPKVLIPVFPGTNCEYDTARAMEQAGAEPEIFVINNLSAAGIAQSARSFARSAEKSQIIFIPGGFSGGDEPDGSGKFITAFFRNPEISEQVNKLLGQRDGLVGGICNGFQALIKLGLVPYGEIRDTDETCPTLTYNIIGRHQSRLVRTRVASNLSPWLMKSNVGDIHTVPISHGEGRFVCDSALLSQLAANGQIATQYVDADGKPTMDIRFNPNGSVAAVEGITSADGRVFGKMGHSERKGTNLYKNVEGNKDNGMFLGAVEYFK
ncbi:MAG: phosphoribosylformylglycinamidine synthase [Clostridiales bacterium]|nr:phosphoribosylformylglycinamidine synthase [Clostridiales bacterium]